MRLINARTLKLEEFNETNRPPYAILSHSWGDKELTFQDMQGDTGQHYWKAGYCKIFGTCKVALNFGIEYAWVDTCCIDKTSSAELSEAINSMFRWYEDAEICYAYLSDIYDPPYAEVAVVQSRWFTRGWTLQELIAPRHLVFYATNWEYINSRSNLSKAISSATRIDERRLQDNRAKAGSILRSSSIAQRMSWASRRQTTRTEDLAYCLLGIFDINMPLLYGEGTKTFTRLQEQIIQHTDDQSIFAWGLRNGIKPESSPDTSTSVLAPSPAAFVASGDIVQVNTGEESTPFSLTNRGIRIDLRVEWIRGRRYGIIPCRRNKATDLLMIQLQELQGNRFFRVSDAPVTWRSYLAWKRTPKIPVYLMTAPPPEKHRIPSGSFLVELPRGKIAVHRVSEGYTWSPATGLITMNEPEPRFGRETKLRLVLKPIINRGLSCSESLTVSIWIRWPSKYFEECEWVTYDVKYSSHKEQLRMRSQSVGPFFAKVEKQVVFGQRVVVIEVFSWESENKMLNQLQWARMCLGRLLDRCLFGVLGVRGSWFIILSPQLIQGPVGFKPALKLALALVIMSGQDLQLEPRLLDVIGTLFTSKICGACYLLYISLDSPYIYDLVAPIVYCVVAWICLSIWTVRLFLGTYLILTLGLLCHRSWCDHALYYR
ncbi:heterokaryon incompatibility protein-domain-containing protein [Fusarium solani]|jgi:hypothetical protein|uniref:Heterokaryon incompatibility protein-domain-containing protein n=1 Tax=Fusarium solani TaxID=169388 RepID=A0A9P9KEP8_FUSSL|nr:heterokaryon incompatibility protein-domain-containing protein [Fusarium solani]KAH7254591.1 heterokaryon incompatibility protein-domain-containing protein [Fusarium solani]